MSGGNAEKNRPEIESYVCHCGYLKTTQNQINHERCFTGMIHTTPLDIASAELVAKGTPLVADDKPVEICVNCTRLICECGTIKTDVRTFRTGATRDTDEGKPRFHAYSCPLVDQSYGSYMLKHQKQSDGTMRPADNWKKRMPLDEVLESLIRHVKDLELHHDGYIDQCREKDIHEVLNGCAANINFYHHGIIQDELKKDKPEPVEHYCYNCADEFTGINEKPCDKCEDNNNWQPKESA